MPADGFGINESPGPPAVGVGTDPSLLVGAVSCAAFLAAALVGDVGGTGAVLVPCDGVSARLRGPVDGVQAFLAAGGTFNPGHQEFGVGPHAGALGAVVDVPQWKVRLCGHDDYPSLGSCLGFVNHGASRLETVNYR